MRAAQGKSEVDVEARSRACMSWLPHFPEHEGQVGQYHITSVVRIGKLPCRARGHKPAMVNLALRG